MLYAVAAVELEDRVETRGDLLNVLQTNPAAIRILRPSGANIPALAVSPDGRLLASGDEAGVVRFTDLRSWEPSGAPMRLPGAIAPLAMAFSPDGRTLAVGTRKADRSELHLVDVATRRDRRIGSWRGLVRKHAHHGARLRARRAPPRGEPGDDVADIRHAGRRAAPAPRRPHRASGLAAPLPAPPRPVGGAPAVPSRRRADQLRPAGRDAGVGRAGRPDRAPLPDRRAVRPLARQPPARGRPQQPISGRAELLGGSAGPAHRSSHRAGRRPTRRVDPEPRLHTRRDADRRSGRRRHPRLGRRLGLDRRDVRGRAWRAARRRRPGPPGTGDRQPRRRQPRCVGSGRRAAPRPPFPLDHAAARLLREPMHGDRSAGRGDGDQPRRRNRRR